MNPSHACKNLRTKKMYIPAQADEAFVASEDGSGGAPHCWCNCTLTEIGPDDGQVNSQACRSSRSCYEE
jgi:hypothetical protein